MTFHAAIIQLYGDKELYLLTREGIFNKEG